MRPMTERVTTEQVLDAIARERARLMAAIDGLGDAASTLTVTDEGWTAKDTLAHLIHWANAVAFGLGADVQPPPYMVAERMRRKAAGLPDTMPSGEESNAMAVAFFAEIPMQDVRAQFEGLVDSIVERVRERTDDEMNATGAIAWASGRPLWQFVAGDTYQHWPLHAETIERALSRPST
jgi:hypothetical protein